MMATLPLSPLREVGRSGGKILGSSGRIFQVVSIFYILSQSGPQLHAFNQLFNTRPLVSLSSLLDLDYNINEFDLAPSQNLIERYRRIQQRNEGY